MSKKAENSSLPPTQQLEELLNDNGRIEELSPSPVDEREEDDYDYESASSSASDSLSASNGQNVHGWMGNMKPIPSLYTSLPFIVDDLVTPTSTAQDRVADLCRRLLSGEEREIHDLNSHGIPRLQRQKHIKFLHKSLNTYPAPYQAMDASRPWILYWALAGLAHLGEDVSMYRERAMATFAPSQNGSGGFGGGHGQFSHGAASYASTLALALVGGLEIIDRKAMWHWLGSIKQSSGGFAMAVDGEIDVRGAYCSMTIVALLNLPLDLPPDAPARSAGLTSFTDGLGAWIGRCQTFEGGVGGAPDTEAHGAYAFCALACLSIVGPPHVTIPQHMDVDWLVRWLASRQPAPEAGFSGRTNKLVDACYSHWVGGCWALLEAAVRKPEPRGHTSSLWNREGLVRYTLCCSQTKQGGLRDKPGTRQDGYHTCYSLAGLSASQNVWTWHADGVDGEESGASNLDAPFRWQARMATNAERKSWAFDEEDAVGFVHPVFVMPSATVARTKKQFAGTVGF